MRVNPATGLPEEVRPSPSIWEMAFQTLPIVPGVVRGLAAGGRTPYDTTSTWDLVTRGKPDWQLFNDPKNTPGSRPITPQIGGINVPLSPLLALTGINPRRRDRNAEIAAYQRGQKRLADARSQTKRRIAKVTSGP